MHKTLVINVHSRLLHVFYILSYLSSFLYHPFPAGMDGEAVSPSSSSPPTFDISEDFIPSRPSKPAGQISLSFSNRLLPPLLLQEDLKEGCGGQLWPAGMVLTDYLLDKIEELRGQTICELGAGGGLVGLALALALQQSASATATETKIFITDLPILVPLQEQNIALNGFPTSLIQSISLPWGTTLPPSLPRVDIVLAADCVYFEPAFEPLLETLRTLLKEERQICYFCLKKRRKADMRFVAMLKKRFDVVELKNGTEGLEKGVFLWVLI
jgi:predicted nicotinamide N-methyase